MKLNSSRTVLSIPSMSPHTALTFLLVDKYLATMLPPATRESLRVYITNAEKILHKFSSSNLGNWPQKIKVAPRNFRLQPPDFQPQILETVFEAVLAEKKLTLGYRRRNEQAIKTYSDINPLGLVFVDHLIYLVSTVGNYTDPLQFLLHRMTSATILPQSVMTPDRFSLQGYLDQGEFSYPTGEGILRLKALF